MHRDQRGILTNSDILFPLTPTLSLGERETRPASAYGAAFSTSRRLRQAKACTTNHNRLAAGVRGSAVRENLRVIAGPFQKTDL